MEHWKRPEGTIPPEEYAHLSEKEKMLQSYPYHPSDPVLAAERLKARILCKEFNEIIPGFNEEADKRRKEIVKLLFHPDSSDDIFIEPIMRIDYGYNVCFGKQCFVNFDFCVLDSAPLKIGDNCQIAPGVQIYTATHPTDPPARLEHELTKPVTIGNNVWIGGNAIILPGVKIDDNVTIGAGSVVTKDFPSNCVIAGNPAKIIKKLDGFGN